MAPVMFTAGAALHPGMLVGFEAAYGLFSAQGGRMFQAYCFLEGME